jgi:hypothetical protein
VFGVDTEAALRGEVTAGFAHQAAKLVTPVTAHAFKEASLNGVKVDSEVSLRHCCCFCGLFVGVFSSARAEAKGQDCLAATPTNADNGVNGKTVSLYVDRAS